MKGTSKVMYQLALLQAENRDLRKANETLSKRRNRKKARLQEGGSLNLQEAQAIKDQRDIAEQIKQETKGSTHRCKREETRVQRCSNCNTTGHNARTCQIVIETSEEDNSK